MTDETEAVRRAFLDYAQAFEELNPSKVLQFYHYPALLIAPQKAVAINTRLKGFVTFVAVMTELKRRDYHHSKTEFLNVKLLSNNLAAVTGVVIRYQKDETELERYGLTYTFRKVDNLWKIIVGSLHDVQG